MDIWDFDYDEFDTGDDFAFNQWVEDAEEDLVLMTLEEWVASIMLEEEDGNDLPF